MHIVKFSAPLEIAGKTCHAGKEYLIHNGFVGELMSCADPTPCMDGRVRPVNRTLEVRPFSEQQINPFDDYNGRNVWLLRPGGYGDLLMLTPTIREIKRRWPEAIVRVVCMDSHAPVLERCGAGIASAPLPLEFVREGDAVIGFEGVIEDNPEAEHTHGVQLFYERAGFSGPIPDCRLSYTVTPPEKGWAKSYLPRTDRPRVGVQAAASAKTRSMQPWVLSRALELMVAAGYEVLFFGVPGKVECAVEGVRNLAKEGLTFRHSAALLYTCDVAVTPDSALFHVAQALEVPVVGLFSAFPAGLRQTGSNDLTTILSGEGRCAPCFYHASPTVHFPKDRACSIAGFCTVLAQIQPEEIARAVSNALTRREGHGLTRMDRDLPQLHG